MARILRTKDILTAASKHLHYELWMLQSSASTQPQGSPSHVVNNALLETIALHSRVILDFLYDDNPRTDDVNAIDYISNWREIRPDKPKDLDEIDRRVGKEVAHLTYARLDVDPALKGWDVQKLASTVSELMGFFIARCRKDLLSSEWKV